MFEYLLFSLQGYVLIVGIVLSCSIQAFHHSFPTKIMYSRPIQASISKTSRVKRVIDASFYHINVYEPHSKITELARKSIFTFENYEKHHPSSSQPLTQISFQAAKEFVDSFYAKKQSEGTVDNSKSKLKKFILDSGCGRGLSSAKLAKLYPEYPVIGIDRSHKRLKENSHYQVLPGQEKWTEKRGRVETGMNGLSEDELEERMLAEELEEEEELAKTMANNGDVSLCTQLEDKSQQRYDNLLLIRGELLSFWKMIALESDLVVDRHYLLHPNPSPKAKQVKDRFHGRLFQSFVQLSLV